MSREAVEAAFSQLRARIHPAHYESLEDLRELCFDYAEDTYEAGRDAGWTDGLHIGRSEQMDAEDSLRTRLNTARTRADRREAFGLPLDGLPPSEAIDWALNLAR